jgi:hypothetical protein
VAPRQRTGQGALTRGLLVAALVGTVLPLAGGGRASFAGDPDAARRVEEALNHDRREAVRKGCRFIAGRQQRGGQFGEDRAAVAYTALAALALMADGSGIDRGPHGEQVAKAVEYLLNRAQHGSPRYPEGFFYVEQDNNSKMHGQGYATLALASALGSAKADTAVRIRRTLRKAVLVCEKAQTGTGGWGYEPSPEGDHEGSVTVTVAQGLRAARDAGILVDHTVVRRGLGYLVRSQKDDGSFKYSISTDRSTYALTAAALSSFYLFGAYGRDGDYREAIDRGLEYLRRTLPTAVRRPEWFFYGHFYAAWAAWQRDGDEPDPDGTGFWGPWHSTVYPVLLAKQAENGSWSEEEAVTRFDFGPLLATSFAVLTLAVPDEQIPIFQR